MTSPGTAVADEHAAPVARDDVVSVLGPARLTVDVLANDTSLTPAVITVGSPTHGAASVVAAPDGRGPQVVYRAASSWFGPDSFTYSLSDASGMTAWATVRVTVRALPPVVRADAARTTRGTAVSVAVLSNDRDPYAGPLHLVAATRGQHGTTSLVNGRVVYRPARGFTGTDRFRYVVSARSGARTTGVVVVTTTAPRAVRVALTSPTVISASMTTLLVGSVSSLAAGSPAVTLQYLGAAGWTTFRRAVPDTTGGFAFWFTTTGPGVITWRAVAVWPTGTRRVSRPFTMRVLASAAPIVSGPLSAGDVPFSWRPGCPVAPKALRRVTISYWGFDGLVHRGDVIVAASAVRTVVRVLSAAFAARFRIRTMVPVDAFYASGTRSPTESDIASMSADNSSAFNCRPVTGDPSRVSQHAYGNAIDINPFENPYTTAKVTYPEAASDAYVRDRARHRSDLGVLTPTGVVVQSFSGAGWTWGGRWARHDYQHFSANGG
jgi:hypothetical protein